MATRRPSLGLRRGGPGLSARSVSAAVLLLPLLAGCFGLSDREEAQLSVHVENSLDFHRRGSYMQALHQARFALTLDESNITMRIVEGDSLVKLGAARGDVSLIDEGLEVLETLADGRGGDYYGSWLALARADIARALAHQDEAAKIERRLRSDFLSEADRKREEGWHAVEIESAGQRFVQAERALRRVLAFDNQSDNIEATVDLVIVLNSIGGREDEAVALAGRAIDLLQEATGISRRLLQKDLSLDAEKKLELQRRIDGHLAKEGQLRDIQLTIHYRQGQLQACLADLAGLELRQLIRTQHYQMRAEILEALGRYDDAAADLEEFLRQRARSNDYDDVAAAAYDDIERLKALSAAGAGP